MAIPLTTAIALASAGVSILDKLFGGDEGGDIPRPSISPPYTSPYLRQMDTYLTNYIEGMLNAFLGSGWGMPPELRKFFPKNLLTKLQGLGNYPNSAMLRHMFPPEWGGTFHSYGGGYLGPPIPKNPPGYLGPPIPRLRRRK